MHYASPIIAVVDPDVACRELLHDLLDEEGYRVIACGDVRAAETLLAQVQPDIVILDAGPDVTSAECQVLHLLKNVPALLRIPIILCSTNPWYFEPQEQALRALGCAFLGKPFDIDTLVDMVRVALRREGDSGKEVGGNGT